MQKKFGIEMKTFKKSALDRFNEWTLRWRKYPDRESRDQALQALQKKCDIFMYRARDL